MNTAIVCSGSNILPLENTRKAKEIIAEEFMLVHVSLFKFTDPVGYTSQPAFYNGAFLVRTDLSQQEFVVSLKDIEKRLGRTKTENKAGPRTIDLDLIFWNGQCVHADYPSAEYVRIPVNELLQIVNKFSEKNSNPA